MENPTNPAVEMEKQEIEKIEKMEKHEMELERKKVSMDALKELMLARSNMILNASSLAATILVITTFSEKILPTTPLIKILLIVLLAVIPISLIDYSIKLKNAMAQISHRLNLNPAGEKNFLRKIVDQSHNLYIGIITIVVFIIIVLIAVNWNK